MFVIAKKATVIVTDIYKDKVKSLEKRVEDYKSIMDEYINDYNNKKLDDLQSYYALKFIELAKGK